MKEDTEKTGTQTEQIKHTMKKKKQLVTAVAGPVISRIREFSEALEAGLSNYQAVPEDKIVILSMGDFFSADEQMELMPCRCRPESFNMEQFFSVLSSLSQQYIIIEGELALYFQEITEITEIGIFLKEDEQVLLVNEIVKNSEQSVQKNIDTFYSQRMPEVQEYILPTSSAADILIGSEENPITSSREIVRYVKRTFESLYGTKKAGKEFHQQLNHMISRYEKGDSRKIRFKKGIFRFVTKSALAFKRLLDIAVSLAALLLLSPLFFLTAVAIRINDWGPVIYTQIRIGKHGAEFKFPKFRSMVMDADKLKDQLLKESMHSGDITFKIKKDPRITKVGSFIRKFSIDELPQLWCVLKGDMSLVGPRPPVPREVELYTQEDRRRLEVTPGLTGIWQVSGRADIGFEDQVKLDVEYIESQSVWLDFKLLLKTIPAVLMGKGAY
ncbi:MAG: sugar transferase [Spirochaetales bacterium]|nr:sugar transferase [Spirochaetales bacterium]